MASERGKSGSGSVDGGVSAGCQKTSLFIRRGAIDNVERAYGRRVAEGCCPGGGSGVADVEKEAAVGGVLIGYVCKTL